MKKTLSLFVLLILAAPAFASETLLVFSVKMLAPSILVGIEHACINFLGIKTDIGVSYLGDTDIGLNADLYTVVYLLPPQSHWRLNLLLGLPYIWYWFGSRGLITFYGASLAIGYKLSRRLSIEARLGYCPLRWFGQWSEFPFWPDAAVGVNLHL